jgi:hypothetical protein
MKLHVGDTTTVNELTPQAVEGVVRVPSTEWTLKVGELDEREFGFALPEPRRAGNRNRLPNARDILDDWPDGRRLRNPILSEQNRGLKHNRQA